MSETFGPFFSLVVPLNTSNQRLALTNRLLDLSGPSQSGPGQYPNYPQGQGQQYGAYRPPQPGPPQGQQQRPYGYDQVSIATTAHGRQGSPPHLS